ncbi:MAG: polysaccharide biosynthesis protein, partial [Flavobacteriaceae bacterium]|nr:polysaccharide biosynthesis protein [Flavobacteriaceae bacterium]
MFNKYIDIIFKKQYPRWTIMLFDFAATASILLSYNVYQLDNFNKISWAFVLLIPFVNFLFLIILGVYNTSIRYYSLENLFSLILSFVLSFTIIYQLSNFSVLLERFTTIDLLIVYYISISIIISFRFFIKIIFKNFGTYKTENVLVYGSEDLNIIINFLTQSKYFKISGIINDSNSKYLNSGMNSYTLDDNLITIIKQNNVKKILIPDSLNVEKIEFIYNLKNSTKFDIVKFPKQSKFLDRLTEFSLNPLEIEDLLSRDKISLNKKNIKKEYYDKKILITGGAGSIGSEIIRQLIKFKPSEILILDNSETPMFDLKSELSSFEEEINFHFVVDSILDKD